MAINPDVNPLRRGLSSSSDSESKISNPKSSIMGRQVKTSAGAESSGFGRTFSSETLSFWKGWYNSHVGAPPPVEIASVTSQKEIDTLIEAFQALTGVGIDPEIEKILQKGLANPQAARDFGKLVEACWEWRNLNLSQLNHDKETEQVSEKLFMLKAVAFEHFDDMGGAYLERFFQAKVLERVFPTNTQLFTDAMRLAIYDRNECLKPDNTGVEGRRAKAIASTEAKRESLSTDEKVLIDQHFFQQKDEWWKSDWVIPPDGKRIDDKGREVVFKATCVCGRAIPGKDVREVDIKFDLTPLVGDVNKLTYEQCHLLFTYLKDCLCAQNDESAFKIWEQNKESLSFVDEQKLKQFGENFRLYGNNQVYKLSISVGDPSVYFEDVKQKNYLFHTQIIDKLIQDTQDFIGSEDFEGQDVGDLLREMMKNQEFLIAYNTCLMSCKFARDANIDLVEKGGKITKKELHNREVIRDGVPPVMTFLCGQQDLIASNVRESVFKLINHLVYQTTHL